MQFDLDSAWSPSGPRSGVRLKIESGRIAGLEPIQPPGHGLHALPGFVNAHCHLDLSSIEGETMPHETFARWIEALLPRRHRLSEAEIDAAIASGAVELLATGTVAVGDIDSFGRSDAILRTTPLEGVAFRELVGRPSAATLERILVEARAGDGDGAVRRSLSPHAPYSTPPEAYRAAFETAGALPVATHLAETEEEEELLRHGRGPLAELFGRLGLAAPEWGSDAKSTVAALFEIVPADASLVVIHGNRLAPDELAHCVARGWPIVYCPRSHRYFDHPPHPAARFVALGGVLALGTDSRASNRGLDLWAEMACFRAADPTIADAAILAAATSGGRRALKLETADLEPGQPATFQIVRRADQGRVRDLVAEAVRGELATVATFVRGRSARPSGDLPKSS